VVCDFGREHLLVASVLGEEHVLAQAGLLMKVLTETFLKPFPIFGITDRKYDSALHYVFVTHSHSTIGQALFGKN